MTAEEKQTRAHEHEQFVTNLDQQVNEGQLTELQRDDILAQKALFDAAFEANQAEHPGKVVGYVDGCKIVADTAQALLALAQAEHPGKITYFEPTDTCLFEEYELEEGDTT